VIANHLPKSNDMIFQGASRVDGRIIGPQVFLVGRRARASPLTSSVTTGGLDTKQVLQKKMISHVAEDPKRGTMGELAACSVHHNKRFACSLLTHVIISAAKIPKIRHRLVHVVKEITKEFSCVGMNNIARTKDFGLVKRVPSSG
jgi:hypothetical protein